MFCPPSCADTASGLRLLFTGKANDYVGKSMRGGEIVVRPPAGSKFTPHENSIVGNTCLAVRLPITGLPSGGRAYRVCAMSLSEIKSAVSELSPKELAELASFIMRQDQAAWDTQMKEDAASGRLDFLFEEANSERARGQLHDWPGE